jgi:uncharacterized protein YecE (DUF72 family)
MLKKNRNMAANIRVGVAGWSYDDWKGKVYPAPKPRGFDPLRYLAGFINVIEINSTFYHPGSIKNAESWADRTKDFPDFRFIVKLWQRLTHSKSDVLKSDIKEALIVPNILKESGSLGAVLIQFPWSFKNSDENRKRIVKLKNEIEGLPVALELRHGSWDVGYFHDFLSQLDISWVNPDQPVIGNSIGLTGISTNNIGYFRLHGRNYDTWFKKDAGRDARYDYLYSQTELTKVNERIKNVSKNCEELYVIANNHYKGSAVINAIQLMKLVGQKAEIPQTIMEYIAN